MNTVDFLLTGPALEKICSKCVELKPLSEFYKDKFSGDGHKADCKECRKAAVKGYAERNRDVVLAKARKYSRDNKEKLRPSRQAWYQKNRDKQLARVLQWQKDNKDRVNAKSKAWRAKNPEQGTNASLRRRMRMGEVQSLPFTGEQLAARWAYYGDRCWICREDATATDHVKPISKGGAHMLCNLRPVCLPCNSAKKDKWPYSPLGRDDIATAAA